MSIDECCTVIYISFWNEGKWSKFETYQYRSSIYGWVSKIASHEVYRYVKELGYHLPSNTANPDNYRIILLEYDDPNFRELVVNLVEVKGLQEILRLFYVEKKHKSEIMEILNISNKEYLKTMAAAQKILKMLIINSYTEYLNIVLTKNNTNAPIPFDLLGLKLCNIKQDENNDGFYDFIRDVNINNFVESLSWSERDKEIWAKRYCDGVPPESIAQFYNVSRAYVDTKCLRLRKRVKEALEVVWTNSSN